MVYQRGKVYWTLVGVMGSALSTLTPQASGRAQHSMEARHVTEIFVTLLVAFIGNLIVSTVWWWRHATTRTNGQLGLAYADKRLYYPWGKLVWWYLASLLCGVAASAAFQVPLAMLVQLGMPLGIMTVLGRSPSLWLTGSQLMHRRVLIPLMGVIQFVAIMMAASFLLFGGPIGVVSSHRAFAVSIVLMGVAGIVLIALAKGLDRMFPRRGAVYFRQRLPQSAMAAVAASILLLGWPFGLTIDRRMIENPIILVGVVGSLLVAFLPYFNRKTFDEEERFLVERLGKEAATEEDGAFVTGKLLVHNAIACVAITGASLFVTSLMWGRPHIQGTQEFATAAALQLVASIGNVMTIAAGVHGHLGFYGLAMASMVGLSYLWDWWFRGIPATPAQIVGAVVVLACLGTAMRFHKDPEGG